MLRGNLSTRPFYNERAVHALLLLVAILAVALTVYNVQRIVTLSRRHTELTRQAERDEAEARQLEQQASDVQRGLSPAELELIVNATAEANTLIDQRTFSWTELFDRIEATLPRDVMVTSLRPLVRDGVVSLSIIVIGRSVEEIDAFMEALEKTGAFTNLLSRQEEITADGMYRASLEGRYQPATAPVAPAGTGTPTTE